MIVAKSMHEGDPDLEACYIAKARPEVDTQVPYIVAEEQVGRKDENLKVIISIGGPLVEVAVLWILRGELVEMHVAANALRDPACMQRVLRRLGNVFVQLTNSAERARFPRLADQACRLVESIEEHREHVLEQVAYELRHRDAMAAMEADPTLTLEVAAERYGLELAETDP